MLHDIVHFLLDNGVGQNLTAGAIVSAPGLVWTYRKALPAWREHKRKVDELHAAHTSPGPPASEAKPA